MYVFKKIQKMKCNQKIKGGENLHERSGGDSLYFYHEETMLKIRAVEEGKIVEAFVKTLLYKENEVGDRILVGIDMAGNDSAVSSIHATLYMSPHVEILNEDTNERELYVPNGSYRRVSTTVNRINHTFLLPRRATTKDYQNELSDRLKEKEKSDGVVLPPRIIMTTKNDHDLRKKTGLFIADAYGLPKTWAEQYLDIFEEYCEPIEVITTSLSGEWKDLKAIEIQGMTEENALEIVSQAIQNGTLEIPSQSEDMSSESAYFEQDMTTEDYLRKNATLLAKNIEEYLQPAYDGTSYLKYIGETERIALPAQARAVMGSYHVLKKLKGVFNVGDMGTGKTQISLTTAYTLAREREDSGAKDGFRVLVVAPSNVLPKWATSEIPEILGKKKSKIVRASELKKITQKNKIVDKKFFITMLNSTEDAAQYIDAVRNGWKPPRGTIHFILVSTDRMKLSAQKFVFAGIWDHLRGIWRSPDTYEPIKKPSKTKGNKNEKDNEATWQDIVNRPSEPPSLAVIEKAREENRLGKNGLPYGYVKKWTEGFRSIQEDYNSEKKSCTLARPAQKKWKETNGKHRWMIAQMFQRMLPNHFHLGIFDEVHQMKATDSGRGAAFHKILKSCRKSMFLTGTLTNGESSSIFAILWRSFPEELIKAGFNHRTSKEAWAARYGVLEKVTTLNDETNVGVTTTRIKDKTIVKEKPGIAPQLIANHLLDKCIFVELSDLQIPLVELEEKPIIIELDDEHLQCYTELHREMYSKCMELQREIGTGAWAKFNPVTLNYAAQPSVPVKVVWKKSGSNEILDSLEGVNFPKDYLTAKERKLLEIVREELANDRPCIIYNNFTGKTGEYKTNQRIFYVLKEAGIKAKILDESVNTDSRFEWIKRQEKEGTKVIITNMKLVEVGLDLMAFPTIIYFQLCDEVSTLRQSSRRAWRLGQYKKCKVFYLVSDKTQEMIQFKRLMSRRVSAMITEGRIERSDSLVQYADAGASQLTNDLSKQLDSAELSSAWESMAKKDIDKDLKIVSESEFQQAIDEAFAELTAKTKELCGVDEETAEEMVESLFLPDDVLEEIFLAFEEENESTVGEEEEDVTINNIDTDTQRETVTHTVEITPYRTETKNENEDTEQLSLFSF